MQGMTPEQARQLAGLHREARKLLNKSAKPLRQLLAQANPQRAIAQVAGELTSALVQGAPPQSIRNAAVYGLLPSLTKDLTQAAVAMGRIRPQSKAGLMRFVHDTGLQAGQVYGRNLRGPGAARPPEARGRPGGQGGQSMPSGANVVPFQGGQRGQARQAGPRQAPPRHAGLMAQLAAGGGR